ncbi:MAG: hypothetical protein RSG22_18385 [Comamonas sp.]
MIVLNTLSGAVSEYTGHEFQSITPTHGGRSTGLYALGGDTDAGAPIVAQLRLPATLRKSTLKLRIQMAYLSMQGEGEAEFAVHGAGDQAWRYRFPLRASGQTRCPVGKGIRENYLGFGLSNPDGQSFTLDRVEILDVQSPTRRI